MHTYSSNIYAARRKKCGCCTGMPSGVRASIITGIYLIFSPSLRLSPAAADILADRLECLFERAWQKL